MGDFESYIKSNMLSQNDLFLLKYKAQRIKCQLHALLNVKFRILTTVQNS
jgi:hypothetical protein